MKREKYNLLQSFGFAIEGIWEMVEKERNFKIELGLAFLAVFVGVFLNFNIFEWLIVLVLIAIVLSGEIVNSSIEGVCNLLNEKLKLEYEETREIRNTAAGAVFLISFFAALIGLIIVIPHLVRNL